MPAGARVLIIDDFMKAGGTAKGMQKITTEVGAIVVGTGVLIATKEPIKKMVDEYFSLLTLKDVDEEMCKIDISPVLI